MNVTQICFCWPKTPKFEEEITKCPSLELVPFLLIALSKYRLETLSVPHSISAWRKSESSLVLWILLELNLGQSKGIETNKDSLSIWTWYISGSLNEGELQNKRPLCLSCTYNRSSGELVSKEIYLPFWGAHMGCTDSTFSNWSLGDILHLFWWLGKGYSETGLLRVVLILLPVFQTFSISWSTRSCSSCFIWTSKGEEN